MTLTVSGDSALTRWTPGFVANGVTNLFAAWPGSADVTFAYSATEASILEALPQSTQWYVDAVHGNDGNKGFTPATAKLTLERTFADCDIRSGDTVNALPGTYGAGSMAADGGTGIRARVTVSEDVTLKATGRPDETVIVGAASDRPEAVLGCGTNAIRCVNLRAGATIEGFTLTGGHTLAIYDKATTPDAMMFGGGVYCANKTSCFVRDCIISNNVAYRGGGVYYGKLVNCRLLDNTATGDAAPASYCSKLYYCIADGNHGGNAVMYPDCVYGCTLGPNNYELDGTKRASDLYFFASNEPSLLVYNSLIFLPANATNYYVNCVFSDESTKLMPWHIGEGSIQTNAAALALDADYRPLKGNAVIDAGSSAYLSECLPETDCGGVPRILNGGRIDVGAMEYDWRVDYGRLLGGRVTVTDVTPNVVAADDGVVVPEGALALDWASKGYPLTFKAQVTGGGTLTVTKDGEPFATLTATDEPQAFRVAEPSDVSAFAFAFSGDGSAKLSGFRREVGMLLLVR